MSDKFEPKIIGFVCNWCCYAGADLAGTSRIQYSPNVRLIRVMCSCRINPLHILKALTNGIDGVFIGGCHRGDCHYNDANYYTERRVTAIKALLHCVGIEEERVRLEWISASEGVKFARFVNEFTETIRKLTTNPLKVA